ncbi:MAG: energy transducer TonB, partial [Betaproteobacteria bacterium]|nr:energy transducer TonB [Betaproteobacteria bacterium]
LAAPAAPAATATVPNPPPAPAVATPAPTLAAAPSAPVKVELPNSKADYLHNPPPEYPPMSVRRGEQGQVLLKVLIGADGLPQKVELLSSSGFERLDKAALEAAMRWRYVPGKRGGVAEAMWYQVPMVFNLKKE